MNAECTKGSLPEGRHAMELLWLPAGWDMKQVALVTLLPYAVNLLTTVTVPLSWPSSLGVKLLSRTQEIRAAGFPATALHTGFPWSSQYRVSRGDTAKCQERLPGHRLAHSSLLTVVAGAVLSKSHFIKQFWTATCTLVSAAAASVLCCLLVKCKTTISHVQRPAKMQRSHSDHCSVRLTIVSATEFVGDIAQH